jgi:hypothetical protein
MDTNGLIGWAQTHIVPLIMCFLGIVLLASAKKPNYSKAFGTFGIAIMGIIFIVGAAGFLAFGKQLSTITFGG